MRLKHFLSVFLTLLTLSVGQMWGANQDISLSGGSNDATNQINTWTATNVCTIKQEAGGAQNETPPANYLGTPRWYKSNVITFTAASGIELNSVVVTCTTDGYATALAGSTYTRTGGSGSVSAAAGTGTNSAKVTITCTGTVTAFTISMGGQARLSAIIVNYTSATPAQKYTVTLMDDTEHPLTESTVGGGVTLPARSGCDGYTFAGWTSTWTSAQTTWTTTTPTIINSGAYSPTGNINLYPVYTKSENSTSSIKKTLTFGTSYASNQSSLKNVTIFTGITASATNGTSTNPTYYTTSPGTWRIYNGSELTISSTIGKITKIEFTKSSDFSMSVKSGSSGSLSSTTWTYNDGANSVTFTVGGTTKLSAIAVTYTGTASTTSYISVPNCCTELGQINGSVNVTNSTPTGMELNWNNVTTGVSSWTVKYKVHGVNSWTTYIDAKSTSDEKITVYSDGGTNNKCKCTIPTSCGTLYDFLIIANPADSYCDNQEELNNNNQGYNSGKYAITKSGNPAGTVTGGTFITKIGQNTVTEACGDATITLAATPTTGYSFTSWSVTKTNGGAAVSVTSNQFTMPAEAITVNATFSKQHHNVVFHKNDGGEDETDTQDFTYGEAQNLKTISSIGWTRTNYNFGGWMTASNGSSADKLDGASYTLNSESDVNLYALWVADNTRTISYSGESHITYSPAKPTTVDIQNDNSFSVSFSLDAHYSLNGVVVTMGNTPLDESLISYDQESLTVTAPQGGFTDNISVAYTIEAIMYTVKWSVNGAETTKQFMEGTTYATIMADASKPNVADNAVSTNCDVNKFKGWATELINKDNATSSDVNWYNGATTLSADQTFYAVWAKEETSEDTYVQTTSVSVGDVVVIAEIDHVADGEAGKELTGISTSSTKYGIGTGFTTLPAGTMEWTVVDGYIDQGVAQGVAFKNGNNYLYATSGNSLNVDATLNANTSWAVTTESSRAKIVNKQETTRCICWNESSPRFAAYANKNHGDAVQGGSGNYYYPVFYKKVPGSSTSSNYITTCCEPLNVTLANSGVYGEYASWTASPVKACTGKTSTLTATITDDTKCRFSHWDISGTGATLDNENANHAILTMGSTAVTVTAVFTDLFPVSVAVNDANMGSAQIGVDELVVLGAGPVYVEDQDVLLLSATPETGYRFVNWTSTGSIGYEDDDATIASTTAMAGATQTITANFAAKAYTITLDKNEGTADGEVIATYNSATLTSISHATRTSGDWSLLGYYTGTTDGDKVIDASGNLVAGVEGYTDANGKWIYDNDKTLYAHWKDNSLKTVTINSYSGGTITVSWNSGENSFSTGYRNIAENTVLTITASASTGYSLTSLTVGGNAFTSGNTHTLTEDEDVEVAAVFSLITYNITYENVEGATHSNPATYTLPAEAITLLDASKDGYDFDGWTEGGVAVTTIAANAIGNKTFTANWTAKTYTVTLAKNYGSAGSSNVTATFGQDMPDMGTKPSRGGYEFAGYYANNDGTGTKYYNADKSSAHVWDQAEDKTIYAAWSPKNYTITLNNEGADEGHEGTESIAVTYDSYDNLTSAITKPEKTGYKFSGYFTGTEGAGTQLIDEDGNVIASVSNYTSATKQWKKADNVELHAYWKASYTVTWNVNGTETTEQVVSGEKVASMHAAPTSSDCDDAKVFVGWRAEAITGTSATNPGSIFTTVEGSPEITDDVTFYAVFADSNEETKHLTNAQITARHSTSNPNTGSYAAGPFTLASTDGDWYGVFATQNNNGYTVNIKSETVDLSTDDTSDKVRPYLMSPTYSKNVKTVTITARHGAQNGTRTIYICSAATDSPDDNNIGTASITNSNTAHEVTLTGSATTLYLYASNAVMISSIDVLIGTPSNFVTTCPNCTAAPTFNEAPAISEIACDGATVTATNGLATLGEGDGCNIREYGFVWGTTETPTVDSNTGKHSVSENIAEDVAWDYEITGLTKGTQYYVRAYAENKSGVAYSDAASFWTKDVSSIAITTAPTKTNYIVGETFDATGMEVTATLAGGATDDVTTDVTYSSSALTAGTSQNFAINYTLCETGKSVNQVINVYGVSVEEDLSTADKGVMAYDNAGTITISGLALHTTVEFEKENADIRDNGDGTFSIINPTGTVSITVKYVTAVPVAVKFYVNGTPLTDLALNPYQSENFDMPDASAVANAMTAAGVSVSDDVHFVGWSATDFPYQTTEPTLAGASVSVMEETDFYAVFTNLDSVHLTVDWTGVANSYPTAEMTKSNKGISFKYHYICKQSGMQFQKHPSNYGYFYNNSAIANIIKVEIGNISGSHSEVPVYACSASNNISGSALEDENTATDRYIYLFPENTQYFKIKGDNSYTYKISYIDIYYAPEAVYYTTQFSTLTFKKANGTTDKTIQKATNDTYALTNADVPSENDTPEGYTFLNKWFDGTDTYAKDALVTLSSDIVLKPCWDIEINDNATVPAANVEASDITVNEGKTLTLTLTADTKLGDIFVENGGTLTISGDNRVDAKDFYIEAQEGYSGQVKGNGTIAVYGQAYYDLTLNPSGTMNHDLWYAFAVPFPVDAATGIQRLSNDGKTANAGFNSHYVLLKYDSEERAANGKGNSWKYITKGETLMPGNFYMIALNSNVYNRVRMTKKAGATLNNKADLNLRTYSSASDLNANWNALANNALAYANVDADGGNAALKVITYDSENNSYDEFDYGDITLTVGTPFFVQTVEQGTMSVTIAATNNTTVKAPAHEVMATEEFQLRLGADTESYYDKLFVSANEDAKSEYQIGHDLAKMGVSSTIPQMYVPAYDTKLCDAEFPLVNNQASFPLTFVAPQAGTYQLYVAREARDAELYLTYEGGIIWNLSMSAYELELTKGTTEGYGLLLQAKAPGAATGVDEVTGDGLQVTGAQKVIIDEHVYILRNGQMYGVDGKVVK